LDSVPALERKIVFSDSARIARGQKAVCEELKKAATRCIRTG